MLVVLVFPGKGYSLEHYKKYFLDPEWLLTDDQDMSPDIVFCHGSGIKNVGEDVKVPIIAMDPSTIPVKKENVFVWARKQRIDIPIGVINLVCYPENTRDPYTIDRIRTEITEKVNELCFRRRKLARMKSSIEQGFIDNEHEHFIIKMLDPSLIEELEKSFPTLYFIVIMNGTYAWVSTQFLCKQCQKERETFLELVASKAKPVNVVFNCGADFTFKYGEEFIPVYKILSKNAKHELELLAEASGMTAGESKFTTDELIFLIERSGIVPK